VADEPAGVVPMTACRAGPAAMGWLSVAFGFHEEARWLDEDGVLTHGPMAAGSGRIMRASPMPDYEGPRQHRTHCQRAAAWSRAQWVIDGVLVYVDDVASHLDRAPRAGATLLSGIEQGPEAGLVCLAEDLEGQRSTRPTAS
jgi:uncharacterized glyoxalase superfamily protein PhnB